MTPTAPVSKHYTRWGKRLLDLGLVVPVSILLSPVIALVAVLVRWRLGSPIFFKQPRPGRRGRVFTMYKFRTMTRARGEDDRLLRDARRLTPLGRFLRRTSLDELPTLLNVLRGEMSLVGPRPLLVEYLERYTPEQARRHEVRPGITGLAQVSGRNALTWEEKFARDVEYVEQVSLGFDVKILALTLWKVLHGEGVSAEGHSTMPVFQGSGWGSGRETGGEG